MTRLLLLGSDMDWLDALKVGLPELGCELADGRLKDAAALAGAPEPLDAAIVAAFGRDPYAGPMAAVTAARTLRKARPELPLVFVTSVPDYVLVEYALEAPPSAVVADNTEPEALLEALRRLQSGGASPPETAPPRAAAIELHLDIASVRFAATLGGSGGTVGPFDIPWDGSRRFGDLEKTFSTWQLMRKDPRRAADDWANLFRSVGQQISDGVGLLGGAQRAVLNDYLRRVGHMQHIHFRFSLVGDGMLNVPFELAWDNGRESYLREMSPVARRIIMTDAARLAMPLVQPAQATLQGPVLLIQSDAHGTLQIPGRSFDVGDFFPAQQLTHLGAEATALKKARKAAGLVKPEVRKPGTTATSRANLLKELSAGPWDIVHFAGHSVRATGGEVFLLFPGRDGPFPMRVADFAAAACKGGARLVILSSCESSSPDAVFRLAQFGVPVCIGFRWEVFDDEATLFTEQLHVALAKGCSVARAYHGAVQWLRANRAGSPTFASPMLTIQQESWAMPH